MLPPLMTHCDAKVCLVQWGHALPPDTLDLMSMVWFATKHTGCV